jgi:hypothetical protein
MALSRERDTPMQDGVFRVRPLAANVRIWKGALVALNAAGLAVPGSTAATLKAYGRAEETADNTGGAASAISVKVRRGIFRFANKADDAVTAAEIGADCFIVDDETVAKSSATDTRSVAGRVHDVDASGVWVEIR